MNDASRQRLSKVHPELAKRTTALIQALAKKGHTTEVVQGLRTFAEQDALYAKGRTKPGQIVTNAKGGQSNHNFGLAVDLAPFVAGKPQWNDKAGFIRIGAEAAKHGLEWGGNWK
jgi:peptidoglycan L-alanyl-D-glutamate endopeptidase CwlK